MIANTIESRENIDGIEDLAKDHVVKFLANRQIFRIGTNEIQIGMILLRDVDQFLAYLHPDAE